MNGRIYTIAALLLVSMAAGADAQSKGRGKPAGGDVEVSRGKAKGPSTDIEIRIFRDYYAVESRKPKALPPGIAKNLARGKPLPPGIAKKQVPNDVIVLLPVRTGTRWLIAGDVVVLVDASDLVVDLIKLVF